MTKRILLLLILCSPLYLFAQPEVSEFKQLYRMKATHTNQPIKVDGVLDDEAWQSADVGTNFWQKIPFFEEGADPKTEVMISYDDKMLYVAAKCYQKDDVLVQSLKRDDYWGNDGLAVMLDPMNTRTSAFLFGVTGAGAQWDGLRNADDINQNWSNKWFSNTHKGDGFWSMEMAIPLRIIRYNPGQDEWGLNFVRNHMNENEYHNWTAVPESFWPSQPEFGGTLEFETAPVKQKGNFNIIPYTTGSISKVKDSDLSTDFDLGVDAKVAVTSTLNLDLTVNPDFSQIEVDELVTNLSRFNIFLPEKRTFFLENSDLFGAYGYPAVRPFFSRRIGLDKNRQAVPIVYGARLTGNLNKNTRIGVMNIHSGKSESTNAQNQSAISVQRLFGRSYIQGLFLNRQGFDGTKQVDGDYGRNVGLEGAYQSNNGQLNAWGAAHYSLKQDIKDKIGFYTAGFSYKNPTWDMLFGTGVVQENYYADLGFVARIENYDAARDTVIRVGFNEYLANIKYQIRPKSGPFTRHTISTEHRHFYNLIDGQLNERNNQMKYEIAFRSTAEFSFTLNNNRVDLLYPFSFVSGAEPLPVDDYTFSFLSSKYKSDERKPVSFDIEGRTGQFYNGTLDQIKGNINFRMQPWANLSFGYQWNNLSFPDNHGERTITALLSKLEVGFNQNLFWTTLFQYLDQSEYMGINSRLQWRFSPMSDLFLVYVDNYDVMNGLGRNGSIETNNRALILKVNYWY